MNYGSASIGGPATATIRQAHTGVKPPSTREALDFLGAELECLDKESHELAARLDFFLEPDRPNAGVELKSATQEPSSELNVRIRDLASHVMAIRNRLSCMASRAN